MSYLLSLKMVVKEEDVLHQLMSFNSSSFFF
jgi:hypothetical protein